MGRHMWINHTDDQLEHNHPGCMWGIFHALDYHHWHYSIKNILPHKKHDGDKHVKCNKNLKTRLNTHHSGEAQNLLDAAESHFFVNQSSTESTSKKKRSLKARIKALVAEEICKEEDTKQQGSGFPSRPRLRRTFSIHHLEPSENGLAKIRTKWSHPIIFLHKTAGTSAKKFNQKQKFDGSGTKNVMDYLDHNQNPENIYGTNASHNQIKAYEDVLELFKVNKDLFQNLQHTDDEIGNSFHGLQASNVKAKLTKSGSFPLSDLSRGRNSRRDKLRFKQKEYLSSSKGEKLAAGTRATKFVASKFPKDLFRESKISSLSSIEESDKQGSDDVVDINCSIQDLSKHTLTQFRRTSSLNESLDRYARLLEYSFSRKTQLNLSKSLKLINEYETPSGAHAAISSNCLQNEKSRDYYFSGMQIRSDFDSCGNVETPNRQDEPNLVGNSIPTEEYIQENANDENERLDCMVEKGDNSPRGEYPVSFKANINNEVTAMVDDLTEEINEQTVGNRNSHEDLEKICTDFSSNELPRTSTSSALESCLKQVTSFEEFPVKGWECRCFKEKKSSANSYMEDNADFDYVREILEVSGFNMIGFHDTWHSSDQPLNPSVFEELEAWWAHEPECSAEDISSCCRRELLFDLVNEVLIQIYERSFTYYPRALSSTSHIRPMPTGNRVVEDVWESISRLLMLKPELEQSLDSIVGPDLSKDDSWMNLQMESECVGLELEDLIFEDLLEEVMCSRDH